MVARATNWFALWSVLGVIWAWFFPGHFTWVADGSIRPFGQPLMSILLGIVMLGMGITLDFSDFRRVLKLPRAILSGVVLQFTIMPFAGFLLAWLFALEPGLAVGLILTACCPGGTASNVVAYLARANVALSVTMTLCSTMVAIFMTPLLTGWLGGVFVEIDRWGLFSNMVSVVLIPVVAGVLLQRFFPAAMRRAARVSPLISVLVVVLLIGGIVGRSKGAIEAHAGVLLMAMFLLHFLGFALGWIMARLLRFDVLVQRTICIEVGMQNSGLGVSLASTRSFAAQFPDPMQAALAPVPSAVSSVYHVTIGCLLAAVWRRQVEREEQAALSEAEAQAMAQPT